VGCSQTGLECPLGSRTILGKSSVLEHQGHTFRAGRLLVPAITKLTCYYADTDGMNGRNLEPRTVLWAVAEVAWEDLTGTPNRASATLEDTSPSGGMHSTQNTHHGWIQDHSEMAPGTVFRSGQELPQ
jgi:hypothetical protein